MDEILQQEVLKKTCASLYLGSLAEYRRNLEGLRKSWQNALLRHESRKPGIILRIVTNGAALKGWTERRNTLVSNIVSCNERIWCVSEVIETGSTNPEVVAYVDALVGHAASVNLST